MDYLTVAATLLLAIPQPATPDQFVGCWRFNNGQLVRVEKDGTLTMGQLKGKWRLADPAKRVYQVETRRARRADVHADIAGADSHGHPRPRCREDRGRRSVRDAVRRR
jgi:hypothetical protein